MSSGPDHDFATLFVEARPLIDVRAPIEFAEGSLPDAVNLPLLNDEERREVGITYKEKGQDDAIALGQRLLSGAVREERIRAWREFIERNPQAHLYCFRGGLRSTSVARVLQDEHGVTVPVLKGGYKAARGFLRRLLEAIPTQDSFLVVSGRTGSGKTVLLNQLANSLRVLDLEAIAHHRGSAFGQHRTPQPRVADFENRLAVQLLRTHHSSRPGPIHVEDESRLIGKLALPEMLFETLQACPLVVVEEPVASRARFLIDQYLAEDEKPQTPSEARLAVARLGPDLRASLAAIERRLGGIRAKLCREMMEHGLKVQAESGDVAMHAPWVEFLLREYYDPAYDRHIEAQSARVAFRGDRENVAAFLAQNAQGRS